MVFTFVGGIVTNVMLELVLVRKARMVDGIGGCGCFMRIVGRLIVFQLVLLVFFALGVALAFVGLLCLSGGAGDDSSSNSASDSAGNFSSDSAGNFSSDSLSDSSSDSSSEPNTGPVPSIEAITYTLGNFTLIHVYVSVGICVVFNRLLRGLKRRDKREALSSTAAPLPGLGDGPKPASVALPPVELQSSTLDEVQARRRAKREQTKIIRRVTNSTIVAVSSTMLTYTSVISIFYSSSSLFNRLEFNFIHMLAIDSIVNDLCLLYVALISEGDDAANAQEAEMQHFGSRLGVINNLSSYEPGAPASLLPQPQSPSGERAPPHVVGVIWGQRRG